MNYVTLCTDASPGKRATGYAYYLRSDAGTFKRAWFDENLRTAAGAEYAALIAGLQEARKHMGSETKLIIYCDNKLCLQIVSDMFNKKTRKRYADQIALAQKLVAGFAEVETRHVAAHTMRNDAKKYYMNRWCDINARRQQRYLGQKPVREKLYGIAGKVEARAKLVV